MLVCSMELPPDDPAAAYLRDVMLRYAAGPDFRPSRSLAPERLATLMESRHEPGHDVTTDEGLDPNAPKWTK